MRTLLFQPDILRLGEVPFALVKAGVCNQSGLPSRRGVLRLGEGVLRLGKGLLRLGEPKASC